MIPPITSNQMSMRTTSYESAHSESESSSTVEDSPYKQTKPSDKTANYTMILSAVSGTVSLVALILFSVGIAEAVRYQQKFEGCKMSPTIAAELGADFCVKRWTEVVATKNSYAIDTGIAAGVSTAIALSSCVHTRFFQKLDGVSLQVPLTKDMQSVSFKMWRSLCIAAGSNLTGLATLLFASINARTASQYYAKYVECGNCDYRLSQFQGSEAAAITFGAISLISFVSMGVFMAIATKQRRELHNL